MTKSTSKWLKGWRLRFCSGSPDLNLCSGLCRDRKQIIRTNKKESILTKNRIKLMRNFLIIFNKNSGSKYFFHNRVVDSVSPRIQRTYCTMEQSSLQHKAPELRLVTAPSFLLLYIWIMSLYTNNTNSFIHLYAIIIKDPFKWGNILHFIDPAESSWIFTDRIHTYQIHPCKWMLSESTMWVSITIITK